MDQFNPEAFWSWVFATVVTGATAVVCTCALVKNFSPETHQRDFNEEQKRALRELMLKARNPSNEDITKLLTRREFAEHHVTGMQVRCYVKKTYFLLDKLMYDAAREVAALGNVGPGGHRGREIRGETTTSSLGRGGRGGGRDPWLIGGIDVAMTAYHASEELLPVRGTEVARTAGNMCSAEVTTPRGPCATDCRTVAFNRGGEIAQRWRDS